MASLPDTTARLEADVADFIRDWDRAADAAERNAARIRAAIEAASGRIEIEVDVGSLEQLRSRLRDIATEARRAREELGNLGDGANDLGNGAGNGAEGVNRLGSAARAASGLLGPMGAAIGVLMSILPAVAAAALAGGAALQALGVVGGVVALGWKGMEDAGNRLKASLHGLSAQVSSVFRSGLSQEFTKLGQAISSLDGPIKGIARSIVDVVKEFTGWIRSSQGMNEIKTMLGGIDNFVKQLAPGAKALAQAFTGFGAAAAPELGKIGAALSSVFEELNKVIQKAKDSGQLGKAFSAGAQAIEAFGKILAGVVAILIEMAAQGGPDAASALGKFGDTLKNSAPAIGAFFASLAKTADTFMTFVDWIGKALGALGKFGELIGQVSGALGKGLALGQWQELGTIFVGLGPAIAGGVGKAVTAINEWWEKTSAGIREGIDKAISAVKEWWDKTVADVKGGVDKAIAAVKTFGEKLAADIAQGVGKFLTKVKEWWDKTSASIKEGVNKALQTVKTLWEKVVADVAQGVGKFLTKVKEWWDKTTEDVKAGVEEVVQTVAELPDKAIDALSGLAQAAVQVGKDMIDGIIDGIGQAVSGLVQAAKDAATQAMEAIKQTLGIASPSTVFRDEVGAMIPAGIAQGIIGNAGAVTDAMRRAGLTGPAGMGSAQTIGMAGGGRGGAQTLTLRLGSGADSAMGTAIAKLARTGQLRITANSIVRPR